jgi:cytochrome c oxidase subunit 2
MRIGKAIGWAVAAIVGGIAGAAQADQPRPWEIGFQPAATPVMQRIEDFHHLLLIIITLITLFVLVLLLIAIWKFNAKRNPVPTKTTHNTLLEMAWTVLPVIILVVIAVPSFKLLYYEDVIPKADMTIKATGHQWYWSYEYPDNGKISFDSLVVPDNQLKKGQPRLLTVDNPVVVPVNTTVRVIATGADVIHSWAVPSFGVKQDAVPGRLNETWFRVLKEGTYYGQCSELCGVNHGFMPIEVHVVSKDKFNSWVASKKAAMKGGTPEKRIARISDQAR